jgi:membrane protease YdiL (CAAX protease family)
MQMTDKLYTKRAIVLFAILGILSFGLTVWGVVADYFQDTQAKTEEGLSIPVIDKQTAVEKAKHFIKSIGLDWQSYYEISVSQSSRNEEMLYLLKQLDAKRAGQLVRSEKLPYTYWSVMLGNFAERLRVDIDDQNGKTIAYEQYQFSLKEDEVEEKIVNLDPKQASAKAEKFLRSQGVDLKKFKLVDKKEKTEGYKKNFVFEWRKEKAKIVPADYTINLTIAADKIVGYNQKLKIPKTFRTQYMEVESPSRVLSLVSFLLYLLMWLFIFIIAILRRKELNWHLARWLTIVFGFVFFASFLNQQSYYNIFLDSLIKALGAFFYSLSILLVVPVTLQLFKEAFGKELFSQKTQRQHLASFIICFALTFFSYAMVTSIFNLLEQLKLIWHVGTSEIINQILTNKFMYLAPVFVAIIPAFTEEFFRAFVMSLFKKALKNNFLAIVIAAFIWGFLHTPLDGSLHPGYILGLEKFIDGIIVGYILLYFGMEVAILWHFLNNFIATNMILFYLGPAAMSFAVFWLSFTLLLFLACLFLFFKKPSLNIKLA